MVSVDRVTSEPHPTGKPWSGASHQPAPTICISAKEVVFD